MAPTASWRASPPSRCRAYIDLRPSSNTLEPRSCMFPGAMVVVETTWFFPVLLSCSTLISIANEQESGFEGKFTEELESGAELDEESQIQNYVYHI
ncbi:hypothetical protein EYF80_028656 [Liparis tanakae]|uniref:Uncharacterized protein n=1 Tax=Liparis tanakae TaxID=230148 RepID=A0A4Z2H5K4_9TELE|nr:hypothetical protein EYF80_028656 [Liparis tanakae]